MWRTRGHRHVQAERLRAQATLEGLDGAQRADINTAVEVREAIERVRGLVGLLQVSEPNLRSRFYEKAGILGTYVADSRSVDVEADPCVRKARVGGAHDPLRTHIELG